jgi:hypothetical protein
MHNGRVQTVLLFAKMAGMEIDENGQDAYALPRPDQMLFIDNNRLNFLPTQKVVRLERVFVDFWISLPPLTRDALSTGQTPPDQLSLLYLAGALDGL